MASTSEFEALLAAVCSRLTTELRKPDSRVRSSEDFQNLVGQALSDACVGSSFEIDGPDHPHVFPDFGLGEFGVEVKFTAKNTWRSVANSVFEGHRNDAVKYVYVVFGNMGTTGAGELPEVRYRLYDDCVIHVRTSHVPRFEVDLTATQSLFAQLGVSYPEFCLLDTADKMSLIRGYARGRLKPGEQLWWLEDPSEGEHSLPIAARLYTSLSDAEKRACRAEAAFLCPEVVRPSRARGKYDRAVLYLSTYRGILCHQARDLFSAGSVALRADPARGGNYVQRALLDIQDEILIAASELPEDVIAEYWGEPVPEPEMRISRWKEKADALATGWTPSETLFLES